MHSQTLNAKIVDIEYSHPWLSGLKRKGRQSGGAFLLLLPITLKLTQKPRFLVKLELWTQELKNPLQFFRLLFYPSQASIDNQKKYLIAQRKPKNIFKHPSECGLQLRLDLSELSGERVISTYKDSVRVQSGSFLVGMT